MINLRLTYLRKKYFYKIAVLVSDLATKCILLDLVKSNITCLHIHINPVCQEAAPFTLSSSAGKHSGVSIQSINKNGSRNTTADPFNKCWLKVVAFFSLNCHVCITSHVLQRIHLWISDVWKILSQRRRNSFKKHTALSSPRRIIIKIKHRTRRHYCIPVQSEAGWMSCIMAKALQRPPLKRQCIIEWRQQSLKEAHFVICQGSIFSSRQRGSMPSRDSGTMYCSVFISRMAFIHSLNARVMIKRRLNERNKLELLSHIQAYGTLKKKHKTPYAHQAHFGLSCRTFFGFSEELI